MEKSIIESLNYWKGVTCSFCQQNMALLKCGKCVLIENKHCDINELHNTLLKKYKELEKELETQKQLNSQLFEENKELMNNKKDHVYLCSNDFKNGLSIAKDKDRNIYVVIRVNDWFDMVYGQGIKQTWERLDKKQFDEKYKNTFVEVQFIQ